ncbi:hypothetical protein F5Y13DRAFT_186038 [Hypoxylon sp. FL1857]|nr:hypothetical protein F5Y13DRAFT_186038 [Hypoxylon sp. FL1857]
MRKISYISADLLAASSISNYGVLPAVEADIPILTDFLQASKLQLAINRFLFRDWPAEAAQRANYGAAIESGLKNPQTTSLKVVHDDSGKIVAHLYLTRRSASSGGERRHGAEKASDKGDQSRVPDTLVPAVYEAVMEAMSGYSQIYKATTSPASRGKGIGTYPVQYCRDRAQLEGLPLTISAEPNHHDFFLRRGFRDAKHVDIDLRQWAADNSGYGVFRISRMQFLAEQSDTSIIEAGLPRLSYKWD